MYNTNMENVHILNNINVYISYNYHDNMLHQ